jgi:hypothetical protein
MGVSVAGLGPIARITVAAGSSNCHRRMRNPAVRIARIRSTGVAVINLRRDTWDTDTGSAAFHPVACVAIRARGSHHIAFLAARDRIALARGSVVFVDLAVAIVVDAITKRIAFDRSSRLAAIDYHAGNAASRTCGSAGADAAAC